MTYWETYLLSNGGESCVKDLTIELTNHRAFRLQTTPRRDFLINIKPHRASSTISFLSTLNCSKSTKSTMATNPSSKLLPLRMTLTPSQSKDSSYTYVHFNRPRDADLFEDFCKDKLPEDEIYVPPHNQPINPEDEDDVVVSPQSSSHCPWRHRGEGIG